MRYFFIFACASILSLQASEESTKKQPQRTGFSDDCVVRSLSACSCCCGAAAAGCCCLISKLGCIYLPQIARSAVEPYDEAVAHCMQMSWYGRENQYHPLTIATFFGSCALLLGACAYDYREMQANKRKAEKHK